MKQVFQHGSREPEAFISIGKSRLQSSGPNNYYLNDKSEFEIELFNPLQEKVSASISINGKEERYNLVLYPGQRVFLERFMDDAHKFKFETYEVEDTQEVKSAIANNGKVVIKFYKEEPKYYFSDWNNYITNQVKGRDLNGTGNPPNCMYSAQVSDFSTPIGSTLTTTTSFYQENETFQSAKPRSMSKSAKPASIETGRVEKGSTSNQSFSNCNDSFQIWSFKTVNIQLLPISAKPEKLNVIYCTNCRHKKRKETGKFCPKCGAEFTEE